MKSGALYDTARELLAEGRALVARHALRDGAYVLVAPDGGSLLELVCDPMGLIEVARSDLPAWVASLGRTELLVTVALLREGLASEERAARLTFGSLARAIGWPPPNGRETERLRTALLEVATPRVSREVVRLRPDGSGLVPPPRSVVTGLFRYPPRISVAHRGEPAPPSLVSLEPAYLPLLATGALVDRDPVELAALPSDLSRRLALLAGLLTQAPVDPDRVARARLDVLPLLARLRSNDSNPSRARTVLRVAVAALVGDPSSPYAGSRLEGETLVIERRRPL